MEKPTAVALAEQMEEHKTWQDVGGIGVTGMTEELTESNNVGMDHIKNRAGP
jgi:hypothetical protein